MLVILGPFYVEMENLQLDLWNETDVCFLKGLT